MSWTREQRVTVVAILLLVVAVPALWQIAEVRASYAVDQTQSDLVSSIATTRHAPADYDGDGVSDSTDRCPTRPETENGFQDGDGCPDVVGTSGAS